MTHALIKTLNTAAKMRSGVHELAGHAQTKPLSHADLARSVVAKPADGGDQLQKQANNLIGQTFYATLLKQMHDSPFKSELFSGGRGGEAFNGLYDQHLAQHMAQKSSARLTRPLVKKYRAAADAAYTKQKAPKETTAHVAHDRRA